MLKKIKNKIDKRKQMKDFIQKMPSSYDKATISWVAPEFVPQERGPVWKVFAAAFVIGSVFLGVLYDAWTFSVAVLAFVVAYYMINRNYSAKVVEIVVSEMGIKVGNRSYPFGSIKGFWIVYEPPHITTLNLLVLGELSSRIVVQLLNQDPAPVREFLRQRIPEIKGKPESLTDIFTRLLKI